MTELEERISKLEKENETLKYALRTLCEVIKDNFQIIERNQNKILSYTTGIIGGWY